METTHYQYYVNAKQVHICFSLKACTLKYLLITATNAALVKYRQTLCKNMSNKMSWNIINYINQNCSHKGNISLESK